MSQDKPSVVEEQDKPSVAKEGAVQTMIQPLQDEDLQPATGGVHQFRNLYLGVSGDTVPSLPSQFPGQGGG
jgi:hypothetical protein